jgi:hypothetical protein
LTGQWIELFFLVKKALLIFKTAFLSSGRPMEEDVVRMKRDEACNQDFQGKSSTMILDLLPPGGCCLSSVSHERTRHALAGQVRIRLSVLPQTGFQGVSPNCMADSIKCKWKRLVISRLSQNKPMKAFDIKEPERI